MVANEHKLDPFHDLAIPMDATFFDGEQWTLHFCFSALIFGEKTVSFYISDAKEQPGLECFFRVTSEQWDEMVSFVENRRAVMAGGPTKEWLEAAKEVACERCGHVINSSELDARAHWSQSAISCPRCGFRVELPSLSNA